MNEHVVSLNTRFFSIVTTVFRVLNVPRCARRTRSSNSRSISHLSGWWKKRHRSFSQSCCLHPPPPPTQVKGGTKHHLLFYALCTPDLYK